MFLAVLRILFCIVLAICFWAVPHSGNAQSAPDWSGEWETFWRDGAAILTLEQDDGDVTGTYEPGGGLVQGRIEGQVLRGQWQVDGVSGRLTFALSGDGQTFAGRFDTGEFWNGRRPDGSTSGGFTILDASPRETLQSVVAAMNAFLIDGDLEALRRAQPLLMFQGSETDTRLLNQRRALLWDIIDLSTFRIYDAPLRPDGDVAVFRIGLDGTDVGYGLRFERAESAGWRLVVADHDALDQVLDRYLAELEVASIAAARAVTAQSPRGAVQRFITGLADWEGRGRDQALATLDLSRVPAHLQAAEGPLLADYLSNVLNHAGFVFYQEIPNNPERSVPYTHYSHPVGDLTLIRTEGEDGTAQWLFSADTLDNLPELHAAIQHLPLDRGVAAQAPLSPYFALRERIGGFAPGLLERHFVVEIWQWLAVLVGAVLSVALSMVLGRILRPSGDEPSTVHGLVHAIRLTLVGVIVSAGATWIGLLETPLAILHTLSMIAAILGATWLAMLAIGWIGRFFAEKASATVSYTDEIVTVMAIGILKFGALVLGLVALAQVIGLPYEGVLAGVGVGGLALAFAARETVSNLLGGLLLLTDRPFRKGDLIEAHGQLATVETVGFRSTRLKRLDDTIMIVPNSQLSDQVIINWELRARRRTDISIGVTFDTPRTALDVFQSALRALILEQPHVDEAEVYVGLKDFGTSAIEIECRCYFRVSSYDEHVSVRAKLVGDIVDLARDQGVVFAFPTRTVYVIEQDAS